MDEKQGLATESREISAWSDMINFLPSVDLQDKFNVQRLEAGKGPINLDYYAVRIVRLPKLPGEQTQCTANGLLEYFRVHVVDNVLVDPDTCKFAPYDDEDGTKWRSKDPVGTLIHIDMMDKGATFENPDDGAVICSDHQSNFFRFSTVSTWKDGSHPVNGSREFGVWSYVSTTTVSVPKVPFGVPSVAKVILPVTVFYTRAADRVSDGIGWVMQNSVFAGGHKVWLSLQRRMTDFVNSHDGQAYIGPMISKRYDWGDIRSKYLTRPEQIFYMAKPEMGAVNAGWA